MAVTVDLGLFLPRGLNKVIRPSLAWTALACEAKAVKEAEILLPYHDGRLFLNTLHKRIIVKLSYMQ